MKYIYKKETYYIENHGDILTCKYYYPVYPDGKESYGHCGSEKVDNKNWDVFHVHYETKDAYYGIPMLGLGLMDCMVLKTDTRPFTDNELDYHVGMFGSHSRKCIQRYNIEIEPIVNKFSE